MMSDTDAKETVKSVHNIHCLNNTHINYMTVYANLAIPFLEVKF